MSAKKNKAIVQKFYEASNRGDMDACFDLISDDITWTNIGTTSLSGTFQGKAAETIEGQPYNNTYCWIIRLRDGKFAEVIEFMDTELITLTFKAPKREKQ